MFPVLRLLGCNSMIENFFFLRDELIQKGNASSMSIWAESWTAMKAVMKVQTFQFIVLQGLVGSVPWTAIVFFTLWFELIGEYAILVYYGHLSYSCYSLIYSINH